MGQILLQALDAHTAPLFVSAVRMLPAGLVLLIWAALERRPQPVGLKAWLWIIAFSLADATAFQVSNLCACHCIIGNICAFVGSLAMPPCRGALPKACRGHLQV